MLRLLFVVCTLEIACVLCPAQTTGPVADSLELDEVIITHSKMPVSVRNTVKPVEVITREEIEASGVADLAQLLQERSGIIVNGAYSNPAKDKALYVQGATGAYTVILIDGQPVSDPSAIGGALDMRLLDIHQIERVEILKGSHSALYGADAIAGVINIVTRKGSAGENNAHARLVYGAMHTLEGDVAVSRNSGRADVGMSVGFRRSEGISEAAAPVPPADKDGMRSMHLQSYAGTQITDSIRLQGQFRYARFDGDYDDGAFADADNTYVSFMFDPEIRLEVRKHRLHVDVSYDATLTDREFNSTFGIDRYYGRFHNAETFAAYRFDRHLRMSAGLSYQSHRMLDGGAAVLNPQISIFSPFGSVAWEHPRFAHVEASYRYSDHDAFGSHSTYGMSVGRWLGEQVKVYAGYSTGFRIPTLSMLYGRFGSNPDLLPETSSSWEGGLEYVSRSNTLHAKVNVFRREIDDVIIYTTGYINQNAQSDKGLDVLLRWQPAPGLALTGTYGFLEGELTSVDDNGDTRISYGLLRQPRHRFGVRMDYHILPQLSVSLYMQHHDDRKDLYFNPETFSTEEVTLESYTLINLVGTYSPGDGDVALFLRVVNLTDAEFMEVYGFNTQGMSVFAGARFTLERSQ